MISNEQASFIASGWHSVMTWNDPGVAMYSVTSTGKVHSEDHRRDLLAYIEDCYIQAEANDKEGGDPCMLGEFDSQVEELRALAEWVQAFKLP